MANKERIKRHKSDDTIDAIELCFDFLWMHIKKGNDMQVGIVTIEQLEKFSRLVYSSGFMSGVKYERAK